MIIGNLLRALILIIIFLIGFISTTILAFEFDEKAKRCLEATVELKNFESTSYLIEESILLLGESTQNLNDRAKSSLLRNLEFLKLHGSNWSNSDLAFIIPTEELKLFNSQSDSMVNPIRSLSIASEAIVKNQKQTISDLSLQLALSSAKRDAGLVREKSVKLQTLINSYYLHWNEQKATFWIISSILAVFGLVLIIILIVYPKEKALKQAYDQNEELELVLKRIKTNLNKTISAKQQVESQLKESQRLLKIANFSLTARTNEVQQAQVDLQSFVYLVYHQLVQPIKGMRLILSRMQEQVKTATADVVLQSLKLAYTRNAQTIKTIGQLKKFGSELARENEYQTVYLNLLIAETIAQLKPKELVKLTIQDNLPSIKAPYFALQFTLTALIDNALFFNLSDAPEVRVSYELLPNEHCIHIEDNGAPIPSENQKFLFDLFYSTKPSGNEESSGVGLAMSKYLMERFGGSITFKSHNNGNTFTFGWPVKN